MEVLVRNAEGNVESKDREYAAKKLGRLDRYFHSASKVEMVHREEKLAHRVEITVFADGMTFRGEESDASIRAAIDRVSDKLEVRMRKFRTRLIDRHKRRGHRAPPAFEEEQPLDEAHSNNHVVIKERKHFLLKPMSRDEAAIQMEMIDHNFFIFRSEETNQVEVLYKRRDGKYGLLMPEA